MEHKETAPNCPTCGQFMDKVKVLVLQQLGEGTVEPGAGPDEAVIGWVCPNMKCQQKGRT